MAHSVEWWENYLKRDLNPKEYSIVSRYNSECSMNECIREILFYGEQDRLVVKLLPKIDGNCLFESLVSHGIGDSISVLRNGLATLIYFMKDVKGFLGPNSDSMQEMFDATNEVEFVGKVVDDDDNNEEFVSYHRYTFETMVQDMTENSSWSLLPTQMILMVVSRLYGVKIVILNNQSPYRNIIDVSGIDLPKVIYIGHIDEYHYISLMVKSDEQDESVCPMYSMVKTLYFAWMRYIFQDKIAAHKQATQAVEQVTEQATEQTIEQATEQATVSAHDSSKIE